MTPRNRLASQIYQRLIFKDLDAALDNPMPAAHRALLLADAFVVCAAPTTPASGASVSVHVEVENAPTDETHVLSVRAKATPRMRERRARFN